MNRTALPALASFLLLAVFATVPGLAQAPPAPTQNGAELRTSLNRAFQLIADGKIAEARTELERAQTLAAGPCGECRLGMAHVYAADEDWKRSTEAAREAIPLLQSRNLVSRAYNQIGTAAFRSKDPRGAEDAFRQAVASGGAWGMLARYNLAQVLLTQERWAEAAETAESYMKEAGPKGTAVDSARIVLCQARARLPEETPPPAEPAGPGAEAPAPRKVEGAVTRPEILFQAKPEYTDEARLAGTRGTVIIESIIDLDGCVRSARPLQTVPHGLTEAALSAVRQWVFRPATLEGKPVKVYYVLTVNFKPGS